MRNRLHWSLAVAVVVSTMTACGPPLSDDEAMVVGQWQIIIHHAVWRYKFYRDHTVTLSLPLEDEINASDRTAKFSVVRSGTWRIEGTDVVYTVYTVKPWRELPERTSRIPLAELRAARPFPDRSAPRWERM